MRRNRAAWDERSTQYVADGEACWAAAEPRWGIWGVPESEVGMLPDDLAGRDAIELGCVVTLEWARQWPCEEVWKVRKR